MRYELATNYKPFYYYCVMFSFIGMDPDLQRICACRGLA
jgi:hypothetical protein